MSAKSGLAAMPVVARFSVVGLTAAGLLGVVAGIILGLRAYPPTALFAVFELAVPSAIAGAVVGAVIGLIALIARKIIQR